MKPFTPQLTAHPKRTVLTVTDTGTPKVVFTKVLPSLFGTAYGTKFKVFRPKGKKMEIGHLVSSYPKGPKTPMSKWVIISDLEISDFVKAKDLIQKNPKLPVRLAQRPAATYAEILHIGPYSKEGPTIKKLHAFIKEQKLTIAGAHEEVYLSRPGPKAKTIIRYSVHARGRKGRKGVR